MKYALLSLLGISLVIGSVSSRAAAGPDNIGGVSGRLESVKCQGAYWMTLSAASRLGERVEAECARMEDATRVRECGDAMIKNSANPAPQATLLIRAVDGQKIFDVSIMDGSKVVLRSTRTANHGDGEGGSLSLLFQRLGSDGGDPFMIEVGELHDEGARAQSAWVPVKRRIVSDLMYFFLGGCELSWEKR